MNIIGEKIVLRALEAEDNAMLLDVINDPEIELMLGGRSFPVSQHGQNRWFESQVPTDTVLRCAISAKEAVDNALGTIILSDIDYVNGVAQVHIKLSSSAQGKGYGKDAINTLVRYAFNELRLNCIFASILSYNKPSIKLFERCGFNYEGTLKSRVFKGGSYRDIMMYSILKKDEEI